MNKKIIALSSACVAVVAASVYLGGVYFTGLRINDALAALEQSVSDNPSFQRTFKRLRAKYTRIDEGFFKNEGILELNFKDLSAQIPLTIRKGFLKADADIDITEHIKQFANISYLSINEETLKGNTSISCSGLSRNLDINTVISADYKNNEDKSLSINSNLNVNAENAVTLSIDANNIVQNNNKKIGHINGEVRFMKFADNYVFDMASLKMEDVSTLVEYSKFFDLKLVPENNEIVTNDNGKETSLFDLRLLLKGDNLDGIMYDYDIDVKFSKFNYSDLVDYYSDVSGNIDHYYALKTFSSIVFDKFNLRIPTEYGRFIGIYDISKIPLKGNGAFGFDVKKIPESINGELKFNADTNEGAESIFKSVDGAYQAVLAIKNGRIFLNDERLF